MKRIAFIFPGQGTQVPGMGKDFFDAFSECREIFLEADEILKRHLSKVIFQGPQALLTETENSQAGIFVVSMALFVYIQKHFPHLKPSVCAGLSLGEYTALCASERLSFEKTLPIVQKRGSLMGEACEKTKGTMAVVMGLDAEAVQSLAAADVWIANYNCPGQIVLSGTFEGVERASKLAKEKGAKRVLPLQVQGAFHSGLMALAEQKLEESVMALQLEDSPIDFVMNVSGDFEREEKRIKKLLVQQVTHSVRWEQGIRAIDEKGVDLFIEVGPGKTLSGMNKRIGVTAPTINVEKVDDLENI